jgi:hypothetical protein
MCGKFAEHASNFSLLMLPEYEGKNKKLNVTYRPHLILQAVVHHFQSTTEAISTLPKVMQGEKVPSASGVGTNNGRIPKAMFVGGGFSEGR